MRKDNNMIIQLQRYYALWKECTAMYEEWSKDQDCLQMDFLLCIHFMKVMEDARRK